MRPVAVALAAFLSLSAATARAAPFLTLLAMGTSNVFTGNVIQGITLADVGFLQTTTVVDVTVPNAQSIQLVSLTDPSLILTIPTATLTSGLTLPAGDYGVNGVYDPTQFSVEVVTALPFTVTAGIGVNQTSSVSGSANVLRPVQIVAPIGLPGTGGGGGTGLEITLPLNDALATFVTAVVNWGDETTTTTVLPVLNGIVDVVPGDHDYGASGIYQIDLSFVLNGSSFTSNGTLDVTSVPEPPALWFAPLAFATLLLGRRRASQRQVARATG